MTEPLATGTRVREIGEPFDVDAPHRWIPPRRGTLIEVNGDTAQVQWESVPDDTDTRERDVSTHSQRVPLSSLVREVIHVLHHGTPLCGFARGTPSTWPPGHVWASGKDAVHASCPKCVMRLDKLGEESAVAEYPCSSCNRVTPHEHLHDCAHGIAETHLAGSERYRCTGCGELTFAHQRGAERMRFVLDKRRSDV